jgi:hypothetical protein
MTYGLKVTSPPASGSSREIFQIDSSKTQHAHQAVHTKSVGLGSSITGLTKDSVVFARANSTGTGSLSNLGWIEAKYNSTLTTCTFKYPVEWLVVKPTKALVGGAGSASAWAAEIANRTDYGIQVINASNDICFDSGFVNRIGGFSLLEVIGANQKPGGTTSQPSGYTGTGQYNLTANQVYSGDLRNKYMCVFGAHHDGVLTDGEVRMSFAYTYNYGSTTHGKIYYRAYYSENNSVNGIPIQYHFHIPNYNEIIIGEFNI